MKQLISTKEARISVNSLSNVVSVNSVVFWSNSVMNNISAIDLGNDVLLEITSYLDSLSIIRFLSTSKRLYQLTKNSIIAESFKWYQSCISSKRWNHGLSIASSKS